MSGTSTGLGYNTWVHRKVSGKPQFATQPTCRPCFVVPCRSRTNSAQMFPAPPDFQRSSRFWHLLLDFGTTLGQIRHPIASSTCQVQDLEVHQLTVVGDIGANLGAMATWGFGELTKMGTQPVKMWSWGLALCIICIMLARNMQENIFVELVSDSH